MARQQLFFLGSLLREVSLREDGLHPNQLAALEPAPAWTVLVDEAGTVFDERADAPGTRSEDLGHLVAVVVPSGSALPPVHNFHATQAKSSRVDGVLQRLLDSGAGIFGVTVRDPALTVYSWIAQIHLFVRWVLRQLPVQAGSGCKVEVLVEQHSQWGVTHDLSGMAESLRGELLKLDPARYGGMRLSMAFMSKEHPWNAYVDAVANTWAGQRDTGRDRLVKSKLEGYCLLRPDQAAMERLYLAVDARFRLPPWDWYELAGAARMGDEARDLLSGYLVRLGERVSQDAGLWREYLDEVRARLAAKSFRAEELGRAIAWLERWMPPGEELPGVARLMLESARFAFESHAGRFDRGRLERCRSLMEGLREEAPEVACETALRMASGLANRFGFAEMSSLLLPWRDEPPAVPGLANHGKVLSALGQVEAFGGRFAQALGYFDQALGVFARLSDRAQARRERAQTGIYRLMALMDDEAVPRAAVAEAVQGYFAEHFGMEDLAEAGRMLAGSDGCLRYAHHVFLRALVCAGEEMGRARRVYLRQRRHWQRGFGHPWPWIDAYRGWLLQREGASEAAREWFEGAIGGWDALGGEPLFLWLGEVTRDLARALDLGVRGSGARRPVREALRLSLPEAPHAALEAFAAPGPKPLAEVRALLGACAPFLFH